jgi:hypothetical protein
MLNYENIYDNLKEYMFYPDVIKRNMSEFSIVKHSTTNEIKKHISSEKNISTKEKHSFATSKNKSVEAAAAAATTAATAAVESPFFIPREKDKFFWGFYIFVHGEYEYKIAQNNWFSIEKQWKMDTMKKLDTIKTQLKDLKIKVPDIEDELINCERLSLKGLQVFCILYEVNVLYVAGRKYCEFLYNNDKDAKTFVIENDGIYRNTDDAYLKKIRDTYWKMENVNKPLKGASAYSLQEMQDICVKMEIELVDSVSKKKKTMKVLYQELLAKM